jgi:hypothetical protein
MTEDGRLNVVDLFFKLESNERKLVSHSQHRAHHTACASEQPGLQSVL